jgi:hypothetical protein
VVSHSYAIGDVRFAIRSTSHAFGAWLQRALAAYEVEDVEDFLYSVVVPEPPAAGARAKEFFLLYKGSSAIIRTLDPASLGRGILAELEAHRLVELEDAVYLMASAAQVRGRTAVIPATLGPGLAKLGRRAERLDLRIPGHFAIGIDLEDGSLRPIPRTLDLAGDPLSDLAEAFPWAGRDGLRFLAGPEDAAAMLIPARDPEAPPQLARRGYALANLTSWNLNLQRAGGHGLRALGRFVERTPAYEATWTDASDAIGRLGDAMAREGT